MSGREAAVAAGLVIITIGALCEADNQPQHHAAPKPVPVHTVVIHEITTRVVTRHAGWPVAGWQIMLMVIVAVVVAGGVAITLYRRPE
jgi:hypothetical protein